MQSAISRSEEGSDGNERGRIQGPKRRCGLVDALLNIVSADEVRHILQDGLRDDAQPSLSEGSEGSV
jgi:hypothetical protein